MKKRWLALIAALLLLPTFACAEITFDGVVVAGSSVSITAPFGGTVGSISLKEGSYIAHGDTVVTLNTTKVYATCSGTVSGIFAQEGDSIDSVSQRFGAVMYIAPDNKYTISATTAKAYNSSETKYVTIGETVYIACTSGEEHVAIGQITQVDGSSYTVESLTGSLLMEESVYLYRDADYAAASRIGKGTVSRTAEVAVTGSGSILRFAVSDGDRVARGDLLFETVTGTFDGLYATDNVVHAEVSGVVATMSAGAGTSVNKGDTLLTIYPRNALQVRISVGEYDLADIHEGDAVQMTFPFDDEATTLSGTVEMISEISTGAGDEAEYYAYIDFDATEEIRMGMSVTVTK